MCINKKGMNKSCLNFSAEAGGFEPPVRLPVRQFCIVCFSIAVAKVRLFFESASVFCFFFDKNALFFICT